VSINSIKASLIRKLQSVRYRRAFANTHVGTQIALQLRALRRSLNLTQKQLAKAVEMEQSRISELERPDYQKYNIGTLKKLAAFYDVVLDVRFLSFRELVDLIVRDTPDDLAPPPFGMAFGLPGSLLEPVEGQARLGDDRQTTFIVIREFRDPFFNPIQEQSYNEIIHSSARRSVPWAQASTF
jgi:transcriptional regulator with XRE-family HTH domain